MVIKGEGKEEMREMLFNEYKVLVSQDEKVLEIGYLTMCIYRTLVDTLKWLGW